jgi:BASS family bile acid:Na+ symporter
MTTDQAINVLVTVTLVEMMVAVGLGVTFAELAAVARDRRLVARAAVANYVCVPAVTVGLLLLFQARPMIAAGFLILAVCPGAPYGPPCTALAKGPVSVAVGLMVLMAASSALVAPLLLHVLLPWIAGDEPPKVDPTRMVVTLLATQLAPLCVGLLARHWRPALADWLLKPAILASKVLNLLAVGVILVAQFHLFAEIRLLAFVGMLMLLIASWAAGWLLAGSDSGSRKAMTLGTSLRNVGLGLVIATGAFPGTPAVTAVLVYGLLEVLGSLLLALWWGPGAFGAERIRPGQVCSGGASRAENQEAGGRTLRGPA